MGLTMFTPDSSVYICRNTGLNNTYADTYTFASKGAQEQFFLGKAIHRFNKVAPVRIGQGVTLPINANQVYNCDYMMFRNSNYGTKWFYAFITDVEWVNINACLVHYEIDVVQSWYFEFVFPFMFIEREHANKDLPGDNLVEEGLECGEQLETDPVHFSALHNYKYCAWSTYDLAGGTNASYRVYGGIFSGLFANLYTAPENLGIALAEAVAAGKGDGIVAVTMVPSSMLDSNLNPVEKKWNVTYQPTMNGAASGYTPRNKKLLTYPYRFLTLSNQGGNVATYRLENFMANPTLAAVSVGFNITMDFTPNPTVMAVPISYMGSSNRWDYGLSLNEFPQCAWGSDTYKAWLAQNSARLKADYENSRDSTALAFLGGALNLLASPVTGGTVNAIGDLVGTASQAFNNIRSTMATITDMKVLPPQARGNQSSYVQVSESQKTFALTMHYCSNEFTKSIDEFFDLYGYKTNRVKTPNIYGRQFWNYVKTCGATILGSAPSFVRAQMGRIMDAGIRFWHGDYIGDYARTNNITATSQEAEERHSAMKLTGEYLEGVIENEPQT